MMPPAYVKPCIRRQKNDAADAAAICEAVTHPNTDPHVCAHCGGRDLPLTPTLPFGVGNRHAWLDQRCRDPWAEARRAEAVATLAGMGIEEPSA